MEKDTLTKNERSLLLFFETCMVDGCCLVDTRHMNEEDTRIAEAWTEQGYIYFGRLPIDAIVSAKTYFVILLPEALQIAEELRKDRAMRQLNRVVPKLTLNRFAKYDHVVNRLGELGLLTA